LKDSETVINTANVMFGKSPGLELQMAIFATKEKLTFNDINRIEGRVIDLVNAGERYIRNAMRYRVIIDGTQISRKEIPEIPHKAIREALLNSFCHKNFRTPQNNEVAIYSDRIEIYNPGTFPAGVTPEDYIKGKSRPIHRNPLLAQIMYYPKYVESFGTGFQRIAEACDDAGVKYEFVSDSYGFTVVFYRPPIWTSDNHNENEASKTAIKDSYQIEKKNNLDTDLSTNLDTDQVEEFQKRIELLIEFCSTERTRDEMQKQFGISHRGYFRNKVLNLYLTMEDC